MMHAHRSMCVVLLVVAMLGLGGCFTFPGALREFDAVARIDVDPQTQTGRAPLVYERDPARYRWGLRQIEGTGIDQAWIWLFGVRPVPNRVSNPTAFARRRLRILASLAEGDLRRTALVAQRVHLVASADTSQLNRIEALRAASRLLRGLRVDPLATVQIRGVQPIDLSKLETGWPDGERRDAETRTEYLVALLDVSRAPANDLSVQRQAIRLLSSAERLERDPVVQRATRVALRQVIDFGLSSVLLQALQEPEVPPEEREVAFHELRTLGGPDSMPTLIAFLSDVRRDFGYLREQPTDLRRTIVAACSRLRGSLVVAGFPIGLRGQLGPSPVQILYDVAINDFDKGLRAVALEGLSFTLDRPLDPDPSWAREWYQEWALRRL